MARKDHERQGPTIEPVDNESVNIIYERISSSPDILNPVHDLDFFKYVPSCVCGCMCSRGFINHSQSLGYDNDLSSYYRPTYAKVP